MRAGSLRNRVEVQRRVITKTGNGEAVESFEFIADAAAEIRSLAGDETFSSGQVVESQGFRIRLRWTPSIDDLRPSDRLVWGTRVFDIKFVQNSGERNIEIMVGAQEVLPNVQQQVV